MKKLLLMIMVTVMFVSLFATNPLINGKIDGDLQEYKNRMGNFEIYWSVISEDEIYIGLNVKAKGWVSIGFDPSFMMSEADIKIANVVDGVVTIEDHFGTGPTNHKIDDTNEIVDFAGVENGEWTFIEFIMPINSNDSSDKPIKVGEVNKLIVAFSTRTDAFWKKHDFRESLNLVF